MKKASYLAEKTANILLIVIIALLIYSSIGYVNPGPPVENIKAIRHVTVQVGEEAPREITLPHRFRDLPPRTPVTVTATIYPEPGEEVFIESIYCPGKIYLNGVLGYEFGRTGQAPEFMLDPAAEIRMIETRGTGRAMELRMEFLYPRTQKRMTVPAPLLGTTKAIILERFHENGAACVLAAAQIVYGLSLLLVFVCIHFVDKKGVSFLWLGLLALTTGLWSLGENNFSGVVFKNSTLLYLVSFVGFFTFIIPLIRFTRSVVEFENETPLKWMELIMEVSAGLALLLQLMGILSCTTSMYFFYLVLPAEMVFLTIYTGREWLLHRSGNARRMVLPIGLLAATAVLGLLSYIFSVTYTVSSLLQIGIIIFLVLVGVTAGLSLKDSIHLKEKQKQLAFEQRLMDIQVKEQKSHSQLLSQQEQLVSQQRHDLRHHLSVIKALAGEDNRELQSYLDSLMDKIPTVSRKFCENQAVSAILAHYSLLCQQKGITLTAELAVPRENPHIPDTALCVIFANLLENAVEACDRMESGEKFIRLSSRIQFEIMTVTMDNSFSGSFRKEGSRYRSSKRDAFGIGLSSIETVAREAGGDAVFSAKGNVFLSSVYFSL